MDFPLNSFALLLCYCCLAAYRYGEGKSLIPCTWDNKRYERQERPRYYETEETPPIRYIQEQPRETVKVIRETPRSSVRYIAPPRESIRYIEDPISEPVRVVRRPSAIRYADEPVSVRRIVSVRNFE